jgi:hypothetical protein
MKIGGSIFQIEHKIQNTIQKEKERENEHQINTNPWNRSANEEIDDAKYMLMYQDIGKISIEIKTFVRKNENYGEGFEFYWPWSLATRILTWQEAIITFGTQKVAKTEFLRRRIRNWEYSLNQTVLLQSIQEMSSLKWAMSSIDTANKGPISSICTILGHISQENPMFSTSKIIISWGMNESPWFGGIWGDRYGTVSIIKVDCFGFKLRRFTERGILNEK